MTDQPIEHCYWVEPGKLLAGEYPRNLDEESSKEKIQTLISAGISAFIDLTEADEGLLPYEVLLDRAFYHRFPVRDVSTPATRGRMADILDAIDMHISQDRTLYVHCWGGVGRTGTVVGCWLARHGQSGETALDRLP